MKKTLIILLSLALPFIWSALRMPQSQMSLGKDSEVNDVLMALGDTPLPHQLDTDLVGVSAEAGYELVHNGKTEGPSGQTTARVSRHFVCTSCHNMKPEDPDLSVSDPEARLKYVSENGLPFLQGTTLYGAVNRTGFYNGDYDKKYGELVEPARNNIREAIKLCAVECAQGRPLEPWEVESVLAYLWDIQLKLDDLHLSEREMQTLNKAVNGNGDKTAAISMLHSKYLSASPATFVTPPEDRKEGYESVETGNPENGKLIYELSCLHCHEDQRYAFFELNNAQTTFRFMKKHFRKYTPYSAYQVVRYGTSPVPGKRAYMPNYTLEKMSHQQVEDLRAYITQEAKR
ncbi:MAG: cytochrome c [Bacteroidetes bacterium]|nr:cytochrome c [Bacteroidota bacterium]